MKSFGHPFRLTTLTVVFLALAGIAWGQTEDMSEEGDVSAAPAVSALTNEDCAMCHGGDDPEVARVSDATLTHSSHEGFACVDCHTDILEIPHDETPAKVDCTSCHMEEGETYTHHGRGVFGVTEDLPGCADCHLSLIHI